MVECLELLELHPSRKLGLAIELGIKQWVRPTVKALTAIPMYTLDDSQRRSMGTDVALLIAIGQMMITTSRVTMGRTPPPIFYDFGDMACIFHGDIHKTSRCAEAWDTSWWNQIGRALTNLSDSPLSTAQVIDLIEGTDFLAAGVTKECIQEGLKEIRWKLQKEVDIWERVTEYLICWRWAIIIHTKPRLQTVFLHRFYTSVFPFFAPVGTLTFVIVHLIALTGLLYENSNTYHIATPTLISSTLISSILC